MKKISLSGLSSVTTTQQRRFYILIASLICSFGIKDGYSYRYFDDNGTCTQIGTQCIKNGNGIYETKAVDTNGGWSAQCGTLNGETCAFCGTDAEWNNRYNLCTDNECPANNAQRYQAGDYTKAFGINGSFLICEPGSGWVLLNYEPATCDPSDCQPSGWIAENSTTEKMTDKWCENFDSYRSVCMSTTKYQCVKNYYGHQIGEGDPITCSPCPSSPDPIVKKNQNGTFTNTGKKYQGQTTGKGTRDINECYISAVGGSGGDGYINGTGIYHFTSDCFYG